MTEGKDFGSLVLDLNSIHFQGDVIQKPGFQKPIVHGMFVASLFSSLISKSLPNPVYLSQSLSFTRPVYYDQEVLVEITVVDEKIRSSGTVLKLHTIVFTEESSKNDDGGKGKAIALSGEASVILLN